MYIDETSDTQTKDRHVFCHLKYLFQHKKRKEFLLCETPFTKDMGLGYVTLLSVLSLVVYPVHLELFVNLSTYPNRLFLLISVSETSQIYRRS